MDFKITSSKLSGNRRRRGFAITEFLVAAGISGMVFMGVAGMLSFSARSFASLMNYVDLDNDSRLALDRVSKEIRQSTQLVSFSPNRIELVHNGETIVYRHDSVSELMTRTDSTATEVILRQCKYFKFEVFARVPISGSFQQHPAATIDTAKLVQLTWICKRNILGTEANSESVQSAKIVIRKQE